MRQCVHGYSDREAERLADQADSVRELIHGDTFFAPGDRVLEPGCGIGAQTFPLARCFPQVRFTSFDLSAGSLERASASVGEVANVDLLRADLMTPSFLRVRPPRNLGPCDPPSLRTASGPEPAGRAPPPAAALRRFRADRLVTIVDPDHLAAIVRQAIEAVALKTPGRLRRVQAHRRGRPLDAADAGQQVRGLMARAHELFGADVATRFAAATERETETRPRSARNDSAARHDPDSIACPDPPYD